MAFEEAKKTAGLLRRNLTKLNRWVNDVIVGKDPETGIEMDRETKIKRLKETMVKLEKAHIDFEREQKEADDLRADIAQDEALLPKLQDELGSGALSEEEATEFLDRLEEKRARLVIEDEEALDAKETMEEFQKTVDILTKGVKEYEANAKKAVTEHKRAENKLEMEKVRREQLEEAQALRGVEQSSSAISSLMRQTTELRAQAAAERGVNAVVQDMTTDKAASVREKLMSGTKETAAERLARMTGTSSSN